MSNKMGLSNFIFSKIWSEILIFHHALCYSAYYKTLKIACKLKYDSISEKKTSNSFQQSQFFSCKLKNS